MATTTTLFSLLFVALCCCLVFSDATTIHFHNSLRPDPESGIIITCSGTTYKSFIDAGQSSVGPAVSAGKTYPCKATYWTEYANFKAYDPKRDGGNNNLYFNMDDGGVSLSYDNSKFVKVAGWVDE